MVSGVHGVGKSMLCASAARELKLSHVKASDLIKIQGGQWRFDKRTSDVMGNQSYLVEAVNSLDKAQSYLLDGHLVLRNEIGYVNVHIEVLKRLGLSGIVLVDSTPDKVMERLNQRRESSQWLLSDVEEMLALERQALLEASRELGIRSAVLKDPVESEFKYFLELNFGFKAGGAV